MFWTSLEKPEAGSQDILLIVTAVAMALEEASPGSSEDWRAVLAMSLPSFTRA